MRKITFVFAIIILISTASAFGQNQRKKRNLYNLPEVGDEVLVSFRKNNQKSSRRKKSLNKYANQEISYLKKSKLNRKINKSRRKNK